MRKILFIILLLFILSACSKDNLLTLSLDEETLYLYVDKEIQLSTKYNMQNVFWETSDETIADVTSAGLVTPKTIGTVTFFAYNQSANLVLKLTGIVLIKEEISIVGQQGVVIGENISLTANVIPNSLNQSVIWESLDETIATVLPSGVVTGVSCGLARILATSTDNPELVGEIEILVYDESLSNVDDEIDIDITLVDKNLDLTQENNFLEPIIKKAYNSVIGISNYQYNNYGIATIFSESSGVIYKRIAILKDGNIVTDETMLEHDDIRTFRYYVVTNRHVITDADVIKVFYNQEVEITAELIEYDDKVDLAVLKFDSPLYFETATFADSDQVLTGEFCFSIGSSYGYNFYNSVTLGLVSYSNRYVSTDLNNDGYSDWDSQYIQHSSPINEGSSGGALVNLKGEVIGINSTKISDVSVDNMGFAIPSNLVLSIVALLEEGIRPQRAILGITVVSVKDILMNPERYSDPSEYNYTLPDGITYGMVVFEVNEGVALTSGVLELDIILEFNGVQTNFSYELRSEISKFMLGSGDTAELKVYRDSSIVTLTIVF